MGMITEKTLLRSMFNDRARYLLYPKRLESNLDGISRAFQLKYKNTCIAYSYKTNYIEYIKSVINVKNCFLEVVSTYEYQSAISSGFMPDRIVYNGVIPASDKFFGALNGSVVNIENEVELDLFLSQAKNAYYRASSIPIGLRVTFPLEDHEQSRFGFIVGSHEYNKAIETIKNSKNLTLAGLHCHFGSARQLKYWKEKTTVMANLAKELKLEYINIGGGMFGPMPQELSDQFSGYVPDYNEYADVVCGIMKTVFPDESCCLFIEPGTAIVGNVMDVEAVVTCIKTDREIPIIVVNCSSSDIGFLCDCKDIPITVIKRSDYDNHFIEKGHIYGCTCLEGDVLKKGFTGEIAVGDKILFHNAGAYSYNCADQFICPRLPCDLICEK